MDNIFWKENWDESRKHYLDWWAGKGLVLSMWGHLEKEGAPYEVVEPPAPAKDWNQYWFDPEWRSANLHYHLSRSSFKADIPPVANTHLGPGSLAAILGSDLEGNEETIWIHQRPEPGEDLILDENNRWWQLHLNLIRACKRRAQGRYFVGCPNLIEGLDTLASLHGTQSALLEMIDRPEELERQLQKINDIWFEVFERIYQEININGEMAFCYFSLWAPGRMAKLQSDISGMISPKNFRRFVLPFIREQCQKLDYSMYHLDGVEAVRHLDALLEIKRTERDPMDPRVAAAGRRSRWYGLYRRIRAAGKSIMPSLVEIKTETPA